MSYPQLDNLVYIGQLKAEPAEAAEYEGLLRSGLLRLEDAGLKGLSPEISGRLSTAHRNIRARVSHRIVGDVTEPLTARTARSRASQ